MEEIIKHPKKVLIALPPAMLTQVDFVAVAEHRTRSDLIREALRRYLNDFQRAQHPAYIQTAGTIA
jgi:metal-responsive CopG/Arc/MetJ family transcriptional regulator